MDITTTHHKNVAQTQTACVNIAEIEFAVNRYSTIVKMLYCRVADTKTKTVCLIISTLTLAVAA